MAIARYNVSPMDRQIILENLKSGSKTHEELLELGTDPRAMGKMLSVSDGITGKAHRKDDGNFTVIYSLMGDN